MNRLFEYFTPMQIKAAGAGIIMICSVFCGRMLCSRENDRLAQTQAFLHLIRHIKTQISCYKLPVPDIFAGYQNEILKKCGFLYPGLSSWEDGLQNCTRLLADAQTRALLEGFGRELGKSFADEQIKCCDYYISGLEPICVRQGSETPVKKKLYRTITVSAGLMLIILLI